MKRNSIFNKSIVLVLTVLLTLTFIGAFAEPTKVVMRRDINPQSYCPCRMDLPVSNTDIYSGRWKAGMIACGNSG